jgi:gamma-glutamyltranspeptidase/glutathione hydrolase
MVAATPSGGWIGSSPVIQGLGFPLGTRGQMFYLNPQRPNALAPRKRPRATLTPSLVTRHGEPYLAFGTPGGDAQDQWTLQFFLNYVAFGMNLQEALDAPTVHSVHFPSSFYPRAAYPGRVEVEGRIPREVIADLDRRGHEVVVLDGWANGKVMGIRLDTDRGVIMGGVSPRRGIGYALGW